MMNMYPQHVHDPYGDGTENTLADRREKYKVSIILVDIRRVPFCFMFIPPNVLIHFYSFIDFLFGLRALFGHSLYSFLCAATLGAGERI
jgi:hypothetical protein